MSNKNNSITESELVEKARNSMREHSLPDDVQRKLRLARAEAVAQLEAQGSLAETLFGRRRWLLPVGGVAAAVVLAVAVNQGGSAPLMPVLDEQELAAVADMDMLEDIEFLAWMLEESDGETPDDG